MNIILIGYRGSGKTSIGKLLAGQLWKTFADVDVVCCQRFGIAAIADIWRQHGEPAWRAMEVQVASELCAKDDHVIALGGGTLMQPGARQAVEQAHAIRIYLRCEPEELHRRIAGDTQSAQARPNLTSLGGGIDEIRHVLDQREPTYRAVADHVFDVTHLSIEDAARYLIEKCL
ncbi:MAG: hypothetical protein IT440_01145 [Phycisphaeraceae bacterium]|nr:hypothetical protein [Phycisphaeraceae bacterium]